MKILMFSGSHPRHLFVHQAVLESGLDCATVVMQRENLLPFPPNGISSLEKKLFNRHFQERFELEEAAFGSMTPEQAYDSVPIHYCTPKSLNSDETFNFVRTQKPDLVFIFGTDLIKGVLLDALPDDKINLHLGLSPWYRGSATLFWPFYFLQPQFAGATFHQIVSEADAGDILHQTLPELQKGDGIHDVGVRTVIKAREDLISLLNIYKNKGEFLYKRQKSSGRLFLTRDFHYSHLRLIYELYENRIVDSFLSGELIETKPEIIKGI